uniref:Down syndrome cell adhesion molecule-like protein Dscam2 n=1 Tax=Angiostrongylus cantonensis TaxID=6313 RepID=A0A158PCM4_ANGCA
MRMYGTFEYKLDCKVDSSSGVLFDQKSLVMNKLVIVGVLDFSASELDLILVVLSNFGHMAPTSFAYGGIATKRSRLVVQQLSQEDYGIYQCEASNDAGSSMNTVWVKEGMTPDVDITSTSEKYDVTEDGLVIHDLKKSDSGRYSCIAKNSFGMTSATARFGPTNQSVVIGTNIVIPCEVTADYETNAHVMWFMNGEPIPVTGNPNLRLTRKSNGGLLIQQVGPDNIGEYRCVVTADGKEESASAFLRIIERPQMPTFVRAELINSTIPAKIRVSWVEGFDGNSPIIKHSVEMRTLGPTQLWSDWEVVVDNVPSEECCAVLVDNLRPSVTAEFRVIASNRNVTMPQQPPAAAPRNVAASARSASSIVVQWQQPQEEQWSGDILGYIVRYRLAGYTLPWIEKNVTTKDARNTAIDQLITWREYEIQVAAYNHRGLGVFSKSIDVTTAEGVPTQAPKDVVANVLNSTAVEINFTAPDQQRIPGVNLGYKIEFWKGAPQHGNLYRRVLVDPTSQVLHVTVGKLEKYGHYNVTVLCYTSPGDGPRSHPILIVTDEDVPDAVIGLSITDVMFNGAVVTWDLPSNPNGVITRFVVRYWNDASPDDKTVLEFEGTQRNVTIDGLTPSTRYTIDVMASTVKGDGPREETKFESGVPPGKFSRNAPKARSFSVNGLRPFTRYQLRLIAENIRGRGAPSEPSVAFEHEIRIPSLRASDFVLRDLRPFTAYEVQLFAENMFGRSASTGASEARTYEDIPSGAPRNVRADLDRKGGIVVQWEPVDEGQRRNSIIV